MSVKSLAIRGVLFNWLGRGCSIFITFFLTPFLVHTLGDESYGMWSMVMAFTSYYAMADMGLRGAGVKYIAQYHALDDQESIKKVFVTSLAVYTGIACLVLVLVVIAAAVFPQVVDIGHHTVSDLRIVVFLTGATMATRMLAQVFGAALTALQRHDINNMIAVAVQLLQAGGMVFVLQAGHGLVGMAVVTFLIAIIGQTARTLLVCWVLPYLSFSPRYFDRATLKMVFRFGGVNVIANMARRLTDYAGALIVGFFLGPAAVTFYAIPESLTRKASGFGAALTNVLDPLTSHVDAQKDRGALHELLVLGPRLLLTMNITIAIVLIVFGKSFIGLWLGAEYVTAAYPVLCVLSLARVVRASSGSLLTVLRGTNNLHIITRTAFAEVMLTVVFTPLLTYFHGLLGAAFAVLIAQSLVGGVMLPFATCRVLDFSPLRYLQKVWLPSTIAAVPILLIAPVASLYSHPARVLHLVPYIACLMGLSGVFAFLICLSPSQRAEAFMALFPARRNRKTSSQP